MNALVYLVTGAVVAIGVGVAIWSFIDTRRRYYEEYLSRKSNDK